jgi:F-type H+-transporting ATPase subunit a
MDPIHQFEIKKLFPIAHIGGMEIAFTNSALFMLIGLLLILLLMLGATSSRALIPGRLQSVAEISYEFVANTLRSTAGTEGMKFFPLVFSLFMFILVLNVMGIIPYTFTVTSHIIITVALALLVFFTVIIYGFWRNGLRFFKLFVPSGIPIYILPLVTFIEVLSFLSRPVSHSVRLFANMLAGPITWPHCRADRARAAGRVPASLRLRDSHVHLSQRCNPPGPLNPPRLSNLEKGALSWILKPQK